MLLKCIIFFGIMISMVLIEAAPARKISTTRVGQLEAEYRTATPIRKDQIIQELTLSGFGRIAQQLTERYAAVKKQEKPTQAATVVQQNVPQKGEPVQPTEQQRIAQAKEQAQKIQQYTTQLEQLENAIKDIVNTARSGQDFDAANSKINELAVLKAQLQTEKGDIQALRDLLQERKKMFIDKQEKRQTKLIESIKNAIAEAKTAQSIDQVKKVREKLKSIELQVNDYASDQQHKEAFLKQLSDAQALLLETENKLLQKQEEQKLRAEQEEKQKQEKVASAEQAQAAVKTIIVPSFAGGEQPYKDVSIVPDAAGNIASVSYEGKSIEQLGSQAQRKEQKWIGAEIQVSKLVEQFSTMKTGAFRVKVPLQGVITSVQAWQAGIENQLQAQQGSEAHKYFNDYLKPALAEKIKRLEAQL